MASLAGISLRESGTQHTLQKEFRLDPLDVGLHFANEKPYTFLKAFYVFSELLGHLEYLPKDNESLNSACLGAKITKLSRSPWEFIKYATSTRSKVVNWMEGTKDSKGKDVGVAGIIREGNNLVSPIREMWELAIKATYIPKSALFETFKGVSGASLVLGMGWNAIDDLQKLEKSPLAKLKGKARSDESFRVAGHLIKLAKNVSYVALGVISVLSVFFQFVFAPFTACVISASTVVFTILGYYHQELGQPKKFN